MGRKRKTDTRRRKRTEAGKLRRQLPSRTNDLASLDRHMMRLLQWWDVEVLIECRDTFRAEIENDKYLRTFIDEQDSVESRLARRKLKLVEQELDRRGHQE